MITVNLGNTPVTMPQSWRELTLKRYIKLTRWDRLDFTKLCEALLDSSFVNYADVESLQQLTPHMTWLSEPHEASLANMGERITVNNRLVLFPLNISREPFISKMYMQKHITGLIQAKMPVHDAMFEAMPFTLACYLYTPVTGKPFEIDAVNKFQSVTEGISMLEAVPLANEYHRQNMNLNEKWAVTLNSEYDDNEIKAGIKKFERFGIWGTLYNLAQVLNMTRAQVERLPYNEVYLSLTIEKQKREYRKALNKILHPKKP